MTTRCQSAFRTAFGLLSLLLAICYLAAPSSVRCEDGKSAPRSRYIHAQFTTDDGLYSNVIDDLAQAYDGSLWMRENGNDLTR